MTTLKEALQDCLRELYAEAPQAVHDYYKCRLDGILPMRRRYGTTEAEDEAAHAVYMAYAAADDVRELLDYHADEAFIDPHNGNFETTDKYNALVDAFHKAFETAEQLVDALDEAASEEDEAADEDD